MQTPPDPTWPAAEPTLIEDTSRTAETAVIPPPASPPPIVPPPSRPFEARPRRWYALMDERIGVALLLVLLAAGGIVLAVILLNRDDNKTAADSNRGTVASQPRTAPAATAVQVPSLAGRTRADAAATLGRAGFTVVVATVPGPPPAGQVLAQNPAPGVQRTQGTAVRINVSNGSQGAAATTPPATEPASTSAAPTTPAATSTPAATPATPTTEPAATTSSPAQPTTARVPTLSGEIKSAVQALAQAGLLASIQYVPGDDPLGTVLAQSPPGDASAAAGSHVTLSASSGPGDKEQMTVPDTTGQTIPKAVDTLNGSGLRLILLKRTVSDRSQAGQVVEQTPRPGAQAPKNAQVLVYMGAYKG